MSDSSTLSRSSQETELVQRLLRALEGIEYGSVEVIVQDGRVIQIERNEKTRFARPLPVPAPKE